MAQQVFQRGANAPSTANQAAYATANNAAMPRQPNLGGVAGSRTGSSLLSQPEANSLSHSYKAFLATSAISAEAGETVRILASAVDLLLLTNQELIPFVAEHADNKDQRSLSEFSKRFADIARGFGRAYWLKVALALEELSSTHAQTGMDGAALKRLDTVRNLIENVDKLGRYIDPMSTLNSGGPTWLADICKYSGRIVDAIRAFRKHEQ